MKIITTLGFTLIILSVIMTMTNYDKEVMNSYEKCNICTINNVESKCNCELLVEYSETPRSWWVIWINGMALAITGILFEK